MPWKAAFSGEQSVSSGKVSCGIGYYHGERQRGVPALSCNSGKRESDGTGITQ